MRRFKVTVVAPSEFVIEVSDKAKFDEICDAVDDKLDEMIDWDFEEVKGEEE